MASETDISRANYVMTQRNTVWWLYLFHAACFLLTLGLASFIPLVLNYLLRKKAADTFLYSHHTWQILSFWGYFICSAIGWILYFTLAGIPAALVIQVLAWLWYAYRLIRGFMDLNNNLAMPVSRK